ncbi:MAG: hypothetical protein H6670_03970 [Anaerolineaceae bacterium]|nr:hypothetical protein [Anaerolineaceae bacterium]
MQEKVYSDKWITSLHNKYSQKPLCDKPSIYRVAIADQFADLRFEVEQMVAKLPESQRLSVISKLRDDNHYEHTYYELVVKEKLISNKCVTIYEKAFSVGKDVVTPDWYLSSEDAEMILEVFTLESSVEAQKSRRHLYYFLCQMRSIPVSVAISCDMELFAPPLQNDVSRMTQEVEKWLLGNNYQHNPLTVSYRCNDVLRSVTFSYVYSPSRGGLQCYLAPNVFVPAPHNLVTKIEKKVKKYKNLNMPLMLVVIPTIEAFVEFDDFADVAMGTQKYHLIDSMEVKELLPFREKDGLFTRGKPLDRNLSALVWFPKNLMAPLIDQDIRIIINQNANYPLTAGLLKSHHK